MTVTKRPAQGSDVDPEIAFFDERIRPNTPNQLLLRDELAGAFGQSDQNIERAAAETNRLVAFQKELLGRKQTKRSERDRGPECTCRLISQRLTPLNSD